MTEDALKPVPACLAKAASSAHIAPEVESIHLSRSFSGRYDGQTRK